MTTLSRYFHTVRYLRPSQLLGRVLSVVKRPRPNTAPAPEKRPMPAVFAAPVMTSSSFHEPDHAEFLNLRRRISDRAVWNDPDLPRLWLYNLHYFDDLVSENAPDKAEAHRVLIRRWIEENPPAKGIGWEPYPLSRRVVNWIKWSLAGACVPPEMHASLAVQARMTPDLIERRIGGNHLIANAKALIFTGSYFSGTEANDRLSTGLRLLREETAEQVLADGGHYERSPMYHAAVLEDFLDVLNLDRAYARGLLSEDHRSELAATVQKMLQWADTLTHPDGGPCLFNDCALGAAGSLKALREYAGRLGLDVAPTHAETVTHLQSSGYIRVMHEALFAALDVGEIGPDHIPGHAHADTLSFELSLYGERVIVDTGVSTYEKGPQRSYERGTPAHNTVTINREDSSEVWDAFRVARRARPFGLCLRNPGDGYIINCSHDGYARLKGKPVHTREWKFGNRSLTITDVIRREYLSAETNFHFGPQLTVAPSGNACRIRLSCGRNVSLTVAEGSAHWVKGVYSPRFGTRIANRRLTVQWRSPMTQVVLSW